MTQKTDAKYIEALSGLRGLAALMVVFSHTALLKFAGLGAHFGEAGVMIFFTLSGFLMSYLYINKQLTVKSVSSYAVSRFSRVAPLYLLVVIGSFILFKFDNRFPIQIDNSNLTRHLLFSGSENILWSIPPEVQYYGFFIFVWWGCYQYFLKQRVGALIAVMMITSIFLLYRSDLPGTFFGSHILYFLLGSLMGLVRSKIQITTSKLFMILQLLILVMAVYTIQLNSMNVSALNIASLDRMNMFYGFNSNLLSILLLVFIFSFDTKFSKALLGSYIIKRIGDSSFSLYLTHVVVIYYLSMIITESMPGLLFMVVMSIVVAHIIYIIVERPLVNQTKRHLVNWFKLNKK